MLTISYFGKNFYGWQRQSSEFTSFDKSVQCQIENAIYKISHSWCRVYGSGRTDSGVHALGQVAHFDSDKISITPSKLRIALNAVLPPEIRINECVERFDAFHARFSTFLRQYVYKIKDDKSFNAFDKDRVWNIKKVVDVARLNKMASMMIGEDIDCKNFDFTPSSVEHSSFRDILASHFTLADDGLLSYTIIANAFLYHQVRSLVGTFIEYEKKYQDDSVRMFEMLLKSDTRANFIAPACGLYLEKIIYDKSEYERLRSAVC